MTDYFHRGSKIRPMKEKFIKRRLRVRQHTPALNLSQKQLEVQTYSYPENYSHLIPYCVSDWNDGKRIIPSGSLDWKTVKSCSSMRFADGRFYWATMSSTCAIAVKGMPHAPKLYNAQHMDISYSCAYENYDMDEPRFLMSSLFGRCLPFDNGSAILSFKQLLFILLWRANLFSYINVMTEEIRQSLMYHFEIFRAYGIVSPLQAHTKMIEIFRNRVDGAKTRDLETYSTSLGRSLMSEAKRILFGVRTLTLVNSHRHVLLNLRKVKLSSAYALWKFTHTESS